MDTRKIYVGGQTVKVQVTNGSDKSSNSGMGKIVKIKPDLGRKESAKTAENTGGPGWQN